MQEITPMTVQVHAGDACVTVKGTVFNVRNYADEAEITVSLLEGAVVLAAPSGEAALQPGGGAVVSRADGRIRLAAATCCLLLSLGAVRAQDTGSLKVSVTQKWPEMLTGGQRRTRG